MKRRQGHAQLGDHPRNKAVFLTAYRPGLRASEIGLLRTDDLDFKPLRTFYAILANEFIGAIDKAFGRRSPRSRPRSLQRSRPAIRTPRSKPQRT